MGNHATEELWVILLRKRSETSNANYISGATNQRPEDERVTGTGSQSDVTTTVKRSQTQLGLANSWEQQDRV